MLHNLAHVELNAIDLAWDTVVRFSPFAEILGEGFFADFAHVADDESRHFGWCSQRLSELGFRWAEPSTYLHQVWFLIILFIYNFLFPLGMEICLLIMCFGGSARNHLIMLLLVWQRSPWSR